VEFPIKVFRLLSAELNYFRMSLVRKLFFVVLFYVLRGSKIIMFEVEETVKLPPLFELPKPAIAENPPSPPGFISN
jgi:hypothetical protein